MAHIPTTKTFLIHCADLSERNAILRYMLKLGFVDIDKGAYEKRVIAPFLFIYVDTQQGTYELLDTEEHVVYDVLVAGDDMLLMCMKEHMLNELAKEKEHE